ncbi:MAG TPA: TonB-dependent receptor [Phenylobacterium sp.]|nr:TonB-dependent receptor [Phenylobacterium sp.]
MSPALSLITVLAAAAAHDAAPAQAVEAAAISPAAVQGVTSYPVSFFAAAKATTALDMLARVPGFQLDTGDDVRGFEGAAGNVLIDGARPASKTDSLDEILRRIPAGQVDHVELIRGGAPGIDMQGKSIIANVVRSKTAKWQAVTAFANNYIYDGRDKIGVRLELTGPIGPGSFEGSARYGEGVDDGSGSGPNLQVDPTGKVLGRAGIESHGDVHQSVGTAAYELPFAGGSLKVNGRLFDDHYRYNELDRVTFPTIELDSGHDTQDRLQTELGARFSRRFGDRTQLELVALRQTDDLAYASEFRTPAAKVRFGLDKDTEETIGRGVLKYRWSDALSLEAGGEGALNTLDNKTSFVRNGAPVPLPAANVHVEEKRNEVFGKAVWRASPQWTLEGGLRYETSSITSTGDVRLEKDLHFAKPRLFVTWAPAQGTQVRLRYERVVGQLNFDDFVASSTLASGVVTAGNPDLDPEQAWVSEIAVEQGFWKKGSIALTLRHSELSDAIDRAPSFDAAGVAHDAPSNIGDGTKDEAILDLTLPLDRFLIPGGQLRGTSTWRKSEVTDPTTLAKREISRLRPVEWEAHFSQDLPQFNANWGVDVFGGWRQTSYRFDQVYTDKLKTFVVLYAEYKPAPDLTFTAQVQNLTERGFRHIQDVYAGPRNLAGLAFTDDRDIQFGRSYYLRVRKTFG